MGRFLAIIGAFALVIMFAIYMGWFGFSSSTTSDGNREKVEVTMDKSKIREDTSKVAEGVKELGRETGAGVRNIARKVKNGLSSRQKGSFIVDKKTIELAPGSSATLNVTRSGGELPAMQLILVASPSSNLLVSGGAFKAGETDTTIVIDAPVGAKDGSVSLEGEGDSQRVDVVVRSKL